MRAVASGRGVPNTYCTGALTKVQYCAAAVNYMEIIEKLLLWQACRCDVTLTYQGQPLRQIGHMGFAVDCKKRAWPALRISMAVATLPFPCSQCLTVPYSTVRTYSTLPLQRGGSWVPWWENRHRGTVVDTYSTGAGREAINVTVDGP